MQLAMTKAKASLRRYNQLFLLVAVLVIATVISHGVFMRPANLMVVTASAAAFGLVSFGQALVVIGGGFDLAVGSLVAMSISAIVFFRSDFGIVGGTIGALASATVAGLISGALCVANEDSSVHRHARHAFGRRIRCRGSSQRVSRSRYPSTTTPSRRCSTRFPLGENVFPIIILIVGFVATCLLLHRSKWGRYIYAIGDNEAAARIAGVPVMRTKLLCYGLSGLLCAVGAIVYLYQNISATPGEGADYLLLSFAATILGGVYMYGGEGTIPGVLVGVICLASITSALTIAGIPPSIYQGVLGLIVLVVVLFQAKIRR